MNLQLQHVASDITGTTGMRIIRAIVAGERNATMLASMRDLRCQSSVEAIQPALVGNYQPEHVFALSQTLAIYDAYQAQISLCDELIAKSLQQLSRGKPRPSKTLPKPRHRPRQPNALNFDVRTLLYQLVGIELTQIHGIGPYLVQRLVAECGADLSRWRTAQHFTSWLTLAPSCQISGGKVLSAHTRKTKNRVTAHLRLAAVTIGRTNTAQGAFYRRVSAKRRRSPQPRARLRSCSTTLCILVWNIRISAPAAMSSSTASGWSRDCTGGLPSLISPYRQSRVFLRKATTLLMADEFTRTR
ncbi:MAG: transposase [Aeromonas veronii]